MTATCTSSRARTTPPSPASERRATAGFTLLELMVTFAVIGLAMSIMVTGSRTLLPQTRLRGTAADIASSLQSARTWAVLLGKPLEFCYDLDAGTYAFWLPYATDDETGKEIGPGRTYKGGPVEVQPGMSMLEVRLAGGQVRDKGQVILEISPMGRMPPHEVVVVNPEFAEVEALTLRVNGLSNRCQVLKGNVTMPMVADADFR